MAEKFVSVGQGIPNTKSFWDKLVRMVNGNGSSTASPTPQSDRQSQTVVDLINKTGSTLKPGDWCEIDEEKFGDNENKFFASRPTATGIAITDNETTKRLACAIRSIRNDSVGEAVVFGACQTRVKMVETDHQYAEPATGESSYLQSTESVTPYRIMSDSTTTAGSVVPRTVLMGSAGGESPDIETPHRNTVRGPDTCRTLHAGVPRQVIGVPSPPPNGGGEWPLFQWITDLDSAPEKGTVSTAWENQGAQGADVSYAHSHPKMPALVLVVDLDHQYAKYMPKVSTDYLISCAYGPFEVLQRRPVGMETFPVVPAPSYYHCIGIWAETVPSKMLFRSTEVLSAADGATKELSTNSIIPLSGQRELKYFLSDVGLGAGLVRQDYVDGLYGEEYFVTCHAEVSLSKVDGSFTGAQVFSEFPGGQVKVVVNGVEEDQTVTEIVLHSSNIARFEKHLVAGTSSPINSRSSITFQFLWQEKFKEIKFTLKPDSDFTQAGIIIEGSIHRIPQLRARRGQLNQGPLDNPYSFTPPPYPGTFHPGGSDEGCITVDYGSITHTEGDTISNVPTVTPPTDDYTFSVKSGTLPAGTTLDTETGEISGTAGSPGGGTFDIAVTANKPDNNNNGSSGETNWTISAST